MTVSPAAPRLARLGDLIDELHADATAAFQARESGQIRGPVTGFSLLDREIGGALSPGLHIVHGGPGVGKSAFALQVAAQCGFPAVFVTLEMAPLELFRRHIARATGTYLGRLKSGELAPEAVLDLAKRAAAAAPFLAIADATQCWASPDWIRAAVAGVRGEADHLLIVVDSVHSWADATPDASPEYERLNAAIGGLRALASDLNCPILAIAERNRAGMSGGGLHAGAGTRKIEYAAETVIDLSADTTTPSPSGTPITVTLAKNRSGSPGRQVGLTFNGALQMFSGGDR